MGYCHFSFHQYTAETDSEADPGFRYLPLPNPSRLPAGFRQASDRLQAPLE